MVINISSYAGLHFQYAGVPSQIYDLIIARVDSDSFRHAGGSAMEYVTDKPMRSQKYHLLGAYPSKALEFEIEILYKGQDCLSFEKEHIVKSWLFGQLNWQRLVIQSPEFSDLYFNCVLKDPEDIRIKGANGWKCTVVCDAGGAWHNPEVASFTIDGATPVIFVNKSDDNDYLYPAMSFTTAEGGDLSIVNETDDDREALFESLLANEVIEIDSNRRVTSSIAGRDYLVLQNFNKNFLRLRRGPNKLAVSGVSGTLTITYQNFVRLGG